MLDCDVEEPNGHLFMAPAMKRDVPVYTGFPRIDEELCTHCGACARFCQFNALLSTEKTNLVMAELCHDCGGCALVCPEKAIRFEKREIGRVGRFLRGNGQLFIDGLLDTGEFSAEKIIDSVLSERGNGSHRIIDAPPGCACSAVKAAEGADYALIVTEPTPFALSDMKMVVEMLDKLSVPSGVFINKAGENEEELLAYCRDRGLPILGKLPFSRKYAGTLVEGLLLAEKHEEAGVIFADLWSRLLAQGGLSYGS